MPEENWLVFEKQEPCSEVSPPKFRRATAGGVKTEPAKPRTSNQAAMSSASPQESSSIAITQERAVIQPLRLSLSCPGVCRK